MKNFNALTLITFLMILLAACGQSEQSATPAAETEVPGTAAVLEAEPMNNIATEETAAVSEDILLMELATGTVRIKLRPDLAPLHVERLLTLTREGFYDGVVFHRVIEGFMAQTGDPTGTGAGGSELPDLPAEFTQTTFERGTIGMARTADPDSANSQFFINYDATPWLDGQYTVLGEVIEGMELIDGLKKGTDPSGQVQDPDQIISMRIAE